MPLQRQATQSTVIYTFFALALVGFSNAVSSLQLSVGDYSYPSFSSSSTYGNRKSTSTILRTRPIYSTQGSVRNPTQILSRGDLRSLVSSSSPAAPISQHRTAFISTPDTEVLTPSATHSNQVAQRTATRVGGHSGGFGGIGEGISGGGMGNGGGSFTSGGGGGSGYGDGGGGRERRRDRYFQYAKVPQMDTYEFGFRKGNPYHFIERHESRHGPRFRTKVHWGEKRGGYGEHYWEYNHMETTPAPTTPGYAHYNEASQY